MAEAILKSFNEKLEIHSAGLAPVDHVSPIAIEVMFEVGIDLHPSIPHNIDDFKNLKIDYLITVGEGTHEELTIPKINYKRKLHLGFRSPYKGSKCTNDIREKCREVRDELLAEMDYFYNKILKKEAAN